MSLILMSKKKRKAKKLAKMQAQEAAMAGSIQDPTYPQHPRPPSAMSVPVYLHNYAQDNQQDDLDISNSDDDVPLDSISMIADNRVDYGIQIPPSPINVSKVPHLPHSYTMPHVPILSMTPATVHNPTSHNQPNTAVGKGELQRVPSQPSLYVPTSSVAPVEPQVTPIPPSVAATSVPPVQPSYQMPQPSSASISHSQRNVPAKTTPSSLAKATKAHKIHPAKANLISHALSMGLGRGVDATSKTPWASKGSFQVRRVHESIVETNEGSCTSCYDHEIVAVTEMELLLQKSLYPPENPVTISVEAEANRTINSSRRIVGKKVVTRTLSFQTDFEEKYSDGDSGRGITNFLIPRDPAEVVYNAQK